MPETGVLKRVGEGFVETDLYGRENEKAPPRRARLELGLKADRFYLLHGGTNWRTT
jgi:hypothetical protein